MARNQRSDDANLPKTGSVVNTNLLSPKDQAAETLVSLAKSNPWRLFTAEELALICGISEFTLTAIRKQKDSPFCAGKCRPESIIAWFAMPEHREWQASKA